MTATTYVLIRNDTGEVIFTGSTYTEAYAACRSSEVRMNGLCQALAIEGRPTLRIEQR